MRDPKTEHYLTTGGFNFKFVKNFPIKNIDVASSKANPARLSTRFEEERCAPMACSMETDPPVDFPAIVVFEPEKEKGAAVATGIHRLVAATEYAKPPLESFDAYVVNEPNEMRRELLTRAINVIEGKGQTRSENLAHALEMLNKYPTLTEDGVAIAFNLKRQWIKDAQKYAKFDERCKELGLEDEIRNNKYFPQERKRQLSQIRDDERLEKTIRTIISTEASGPVGKEFVQKIVTARSEKAVAEIIKAREDEYKEATETAKIRYGRRKLDIPTKAMKPVRSILNVTNGHDPSKLGFDALTATQLSNDIKAIDDAIERISGWKRQMISIQRAAAKGRKSQVTTTTEIELN